MKSKYSWPAVMAAGLLACLAALLPPPVGLALAVAAVLTGALVPIPYSWLLYRTERDAG